MIFTLEQEQKLEKVSKLKRGHTRSHIMAQYAEEWGMTVKQVASKTSQLKHKKKEVVTTEAMVKHDEVNRVITINHSPKEVVYRDNKVIITY